MMIFPRWALLAFALLPSASPAERIKLKLSMITSDRSLIYQAGVKSFVDVDNTEASRSIKIEEYLSGVPGKIAAQQPPLVADGVADIAVIFPGYTPRAPSRGPVRLDIGLNSRSPRPCRGNSESIRQELQTLKAMDGS